MEPEPKTTFLTRQSLRERMALMPELKGQAKACKIRAANDAQAVERWLDEYFDKPTTFRSYKKEAERFLVWCLVERQATLLSLDRDDVDAYVEFLQDPKPKEKWCGPTARKTGPGGERVWYPFKKPLSAAAINTALTILNSLMGYLVEARYVESNPFALVRRKSRFRQREEQSLSVQERILQENEWRAFIDTMMAEPEGTLSERFKKERLIFLVKVLFFLGLRIDELARAMWCDFRNLSGKWWFFVKGKGDRLGKVPVNGQLFQAVLRFRHFLGMSPVPDGNQVSPLMPAIHDLTQGLSTRQMSNIIKDIAQKTAAKFASDPVVSKKFLRFSPHWLRHLSASRQDALGIAFTHIKSNLRHQNEQTTRQYVHAYDDDRHRDMEKLKF